MKRIQLFFGLVLVILAYSSTKIFVAPQYAVPSDSLDCLWGAVDQPVYTVMGELFFEGEELDVADQGYFSDCVAMSQNQKIAAVQFNNAYSLYTKVYTVSSDGIQEILRLENMGLPVMKTNVDGANLMAVLRETDLVVYNLDGLYVQDVVELYFDQMPTSFYFSPEGHRIAYTSYSVIGQDFRTGIADITTGETLWVSDRFEMTIVVLDWRKGTLKVGDSYGSMTCDVNADSLKPGIDCDDDKPE